MLAEAKARKIASKRPEAIVIGADQVLSVGPDWFDKPATILEARKQLGHLRGTHQTLHTAVVLIQGARRLWSHHATPVLTMSSTRARRFFHP